MARIFVPGERINCQSYYLGLRYKRHAWRAMFELGQGMKVSQGKMERLCLGRKRRSCGRTLWTMTQDVGS